MYLGRPIFSILLRNIHTVPYNNLAPHASCWNFLPLMDAVEEDEKDNSKLSKSLDIHYFNFLFRPMIYFLKAHGQQLYL